MELEPAPGAPPPAGANGGGFASSAVPAGDGAPPPQQPAAAATAAAGGAGPGAGPAAGGFAPPPAMLAPAGSDPPAADVPAVDVPAAAVMGSAAFGGASAMEVATEPPAAALGGASAMEVATEPPAAALGGPAAFGGQPAAFAPFGEPALGGPAPLGEPALGSPPGGPAFGGIGGEPLEPPPEQPAHRLDRWLAELNDGASSKKRRRPPALDAAALPAGSVRAEVAARQAEKVEALRRAQAERGEAPLELPPPLSDEEDPIEREEKRLCEEEETFMASLKRIRQEERGIVPLPEKLKEVLKAQRAAFGAKVAGAEDQDEADGAAQVSTRAFRVARAAALIT